MIAPPARPSANPKRLLSRELFVGLGVTYDALLVSGAVRSGKLIDFSDPDPLRGALSSPPAGLSLYLVQRGR